MNLTPQQLKKLEKIKKLLDSGNVGIITYLLDLEDKLENDLPTITNLISKLKGDKGDTYELTDSDKKTIAKQARELLNDEEIASKVLNKLSLKEIAKIASSFIEIPSPKEVDVKALKKALKQEILDEMPEPINGENGKDADEEAIIEKIKNDLEKDLPNILVGDNRLDIKYIKGLDDYEEVSRLARERTRVIGGGKQNLYQLNDVNITAPANNDVLKYNSSTGLWVNGTGGSGTVNTDATLTGDGSIGTPLGLNLSNANTWLVAQTFDEILANTLSAVSSAGTLFKSHSGTNVALFGAGGGAGATFYGGVNVSGNLVVDTSLLYANTTSDYVTIGGTSRIASLIKFNIYGSGTGAAAPYLGLSHTDDTSGVKNGGIFTQTRMTSRYLQTAQNFGFNDNSFGNPGVIQWTAWEYSNNTYTTLVAPTEFTGWSYQYYNGSSYVNLLRVHTSGIYIGAANASTAPTAKLHIKADSSSSSTNAFRIWNAGSVDRLLFRDDGRIWVGNGTVSYGEIVNITTSGAQAGLVIQTTGTGYAAVDGFRLQVVDGTGVRYHNYETTPHIFYINSSEVVRMQTGAGTDPVMLITGTLAARYTGAGSSRGGTISLVSSAGTPQDWLMAVGGTDNTIVNGRSWFLYDNTGATARFFVDTSSRVGIGLGATAATGYLDIKASTSSIAHMRLRAGVAVSSPNDGEIWYEDTNDRLMFRKNTTTSEVVSASAVTTEAVTSDTTLTITYNGVTYKLLAKA